MSTYMSGGSVDKGRLCLCRTRSIWELAVPSAQFCCALKVPLKSSLFFFK